MASSPRPIDLLTRLLQAGVQTFTRRNETFIRGVEEATDEELQQLVWQLERKASR